MNSEKRVLIKGIPFKLLFSREQILQQVDKLAHRIAKDYKHTTQKPILLFVLTGGVYLGVDLSRALDEVMFRHNVDTIGLKRYAGDEKGGLVQVVSLPHAPLGNRDIIVVEDLIDEGKTMNFLNRYLINLDYPPKTIEYCTLFIKDIHEPLDFNIEYLGHTIGPDWVVGNGMDSEQGGRGLLDVYVKDF